MRRWKKKTCKVDGILVFAVSLTGEFLMPAKRAGVPVVLLDRAFRGEEVDCVEVDNHTAVFRAAQMLIEYGHRKIALISSDVEYTGMERKKGYEDALRTYGIRVPEGYRVGGRHSFELGYQGMKRLLTMDEPPTAVILSNYDTTLGGILALNESGRNCPDDVSVIGFDDMLLSKVIRPKLWIVSQPMREMSAKAVQMLLARSGHVEKGGPVRVSFTADLQRGDSVKSFL